MWSCTVQCPQTWISLYCFSDAAAVAGRGGGEDGGVKEQAKGFPSSLIFLTLIMIDRDGNVAMPRSPAARSVARKLLTIVRRRSAVGNRVMDASMEAAAADAAFPTVHMSLMERERGQSCEVMHWLLFAV